jgi:hypothetical protein
MLVKSRSLLVARAGPVKAVRGFNRSRIAA